MCLLFAVTHRGAFVTHFGSTCLPHPPSLSLVLPFFPTAAAIAKSCVERLKNFERELLKKTEIQSANPYQRSFGRGPSVSVGKKGVGKTTHTVCVQERGGPKQRSVM